MAVLSNGTPGMLATLLATTGLRELLPEVVSVDEVRIYKPAPAVYRHLADRLGHRPAEVRLVSANAFDVLGATNAGLRAAWCNRTRDVFDTLGEPPDVVVDTLEELASVLERYEAS
jgi:2-haloacid dehalogenase